MEDLSTGLADQLQKSIDSGLIKEEHQVTITDPKDPDKTVTLSLYDSFQKAVKSLRSAASRLPDTADQLKTVRDELNEMASDLRDGAEVTAADIEKIRKDAGRACKSHDWSGQGIQRYGEG